MGEWMWGAAFFAIALVFAGAVAWWLGKDCPLTRTGAVGAIAGGVVSLATLAAILDPDASMRISLILCGVSGAWLLVFAVAGGIRGQLKERAHRAEVSAERRLHRV